MQTFTNCLVPEGGYPTQDGYLRVLDKPRKVGGRLTMLHRLEWEKIKGQIPPGFEVDHLCKNRACQNINHLQLLKSSTHKSKDNSERYLVRNIEILSWVKLNPGHKPKDVAKTLGVTRSKVEKLSRDYPHIRQHLKMKPLKSS